VVDIISIGKIMNQVVQVQKQESRGSKEKCQIKKQKDTMHKCYVDLN
jgi:hypothetical protein